MGLFFCPLLQKTIVEGICYDVQMVRMGMISDAVLGAPLDRKLAEALCPKCTFCSLVD